MIAGNTVRSWLENEKRRIQQEIRNYPAPITACDQQFNSLLEERARISQELTRLRAVIEEGEKSEAPVHFLDEFIRSSGCLDDEAKQKLGCYLQEETGASLGK